MTRPEYLVSYLPYTRLVNSILRVTGDTEKYWKSTDSTGHTLLIRKSNLKLRGSDEQFYSWTDEQVIEFRVHRRLLLRVNRIKFDTLSTKQLNEILKIVEEE